MQLHMADLLASLNRPDCRVVVVKFLEDLRTMLHVARQAISRDAEDHVDPLALYMSQNLLNARARCERGPADSGIGIGLDQLPTLAGDESLAEFDLCLDRHLVLAVGGVAGIE